MKTTRTTAIQTIAVFSFLFISQYAFAGGFDEAKGILTEIRTGIYAATGILAGLVLLWQFVLGWAGRKEWVDILITSMWIIGAGAAIVFATWLFTKGGAMSF